MLIIPELYEKVTGKKFHAADFFNYPDPHPPVRLLKRETSLPANILDVSHTRSFEWGVQDWVEVQCDNRDEIPDDGRGFLLFVDVDETDTEKVITYEQGTECADLSPDEIAKIRRYVAQSMTDGSSLLRRTFERVREQWEADLKAKWEKRNGNTD